MSWYRKSQKLESPISLEKSIPSGEKWVLGIIKEMIKASDPQDINKLLKLYDVLKKYISTLDEVISPEPIRGFILFVKNLLMSRTDNAHKQISTITAILLQYDLTMKKVQNF